MALALVAGCDKAQLLAPTNSTITVSAPARVLPAGGSTEITAFVIEQAGTPVQNGTTVRFSTSLGSVNPVEVQTRNGLALTTFLAGNSSGIAEVRASSGGATGGEGDSNVVQITIGAAAAAGLSISASPSSVSSSGGTSQITAIVVDESGNSLASVPVFFSTTAGSLSATSATSDSNGRATVSLTTNREATVTARVGADSEAEVTVTVNVQGTVTLQCQGSGTSASTSCTQVEGSTVTFTASRGTAGAAITSASLNFGDGTSTTLGNLSSTTTVNHIYQSAGTYTATVSATDANGETTTASVTVIVSRRPVLSVTFEAAESPANSDRWTFTATVTGADADEIESYEWDFGDGDDATTSGNTTSHVYGSNGTYAVTLRVEAQDGRTATAREEIVVD